MFMKKNNKFKDSEDNFEVESTSDNINENEIEASDYMALR